MLQKMFQAFGTINTITVFGSDSSRAVLEEAEARIKDMDARWSVFRADSELSTINRLAGADYVAVCPDTYEILQRSVEYSSLTGGIFDVTMQPLIARYLSQEDGEPPSDDEVNRLRTLVNYRDILFDPKDFKVKLKNPGQKISLGAIAKGYAAEKIVEFLTQNGITDAVINLGGTVAVLGDKRTVGLQHPLKKTGQILGTLAVKDQILVTSGAYEQSYVRNGVTYHHILDPDTGRSSQADLLSVTLVGNNGALLDALATAIFVAGLERGYGFTQELGLQAVFVTDRLNVFATEGLKQSLKILCQEKST